jgi:hypothetical protein
MKEIKKLGHQAPRKYKVNQFNYIEIDGDFAYCKSHNFVYNTEIEEEKLHNAQPCYYTDSRFMDTTHNYYKRTYLLWSRAKDVSLKACIRKTLKAKNIPLGTIVSFNKAWYIPKKKINGSFKFKVRKENKLDIDYKIDRLKFSKNFTHCKFSQELTEALRKNGFIVGIQDNESFLLGMVNSAIAAKGSTDFADSAIPGQVAIAYGHGRRIGFSSHADDFMGYGNGRKSILWDWFGEFNKWSQCYEISKETSVDEIVQLLKEKKTDDI